MKTRCGFAALFAALLLLLCAGPVAAQSVIFGSGTGSITTAGTDCTTSTNCVIFPQASRTSNGSIVVTGTWVATIQFEGTLLDMTVAANQTGATGWFALNVQAQGGTAFVTSATANGQWTIPYALTGVRVRASAYTSGTVSVAILVTSARGQSSGGLAGLAGSGTIGDVIYADAATTWARLADVAAGSYLRSGGVGAAPLWSTATLPNTVTTGDVLIATGTNAVGRLADVATGQVLRSGGVGAAPAYGAVVLTTDVSGVLPTANGGTGMAFFTAAGPTVARVYTFPDAAATVLTTNAAVTVGQGGTGVGTFTTNGVLYGNAATSVLVTAQGAANTVLTANAGAPSFSATPRVDSLGLGVAAPATAGQLSSTLGANNVTGLIITRNTDTAPTGNYLDFRNAAAASVFTVNITGQVGVASTVLDESIGSQVRHPGGTAAAPGIANANGTTGFWLAGNRVAVITGNGNDASFESQALQFRSNELVGWTAGADPTVALDTNFYRVAAGVAGVGTSAGNAAGALLAANLQTGGTALLTVTAGAFGMSKMTASASAPGAAGAKFEVVCGTTAGTAKLVMSAGTSATAVTVVDNVGAGVTGC